MTSSAAARRAARAGLRGQHRLRLRPACTPSRTCTRRSCSASCAVHHQYPVDAALCRSLLDEQRNGQYLVGATGIFRAALQLGHDGRVHERLQCGALGGIGKDPLAQGAPVQLPAGREQLRAKAGEHARQQRRAWRHHVARNLIGIDDRDAQRRKQAR